MCFAAIAQIYAVILSRTGNATRLLHFVDRGAACAAADNEAKEGELIAPHDVKLVLGGGVEEIKGAESASPNPKRSSMSKRLTSFFFGTPHDDHNEGREEKPDGHGKENGDGAIPDPADRAAFNAFTEMITAREFIAVVARRAELAQACAHLEVRLPTCLRDTMAHFPLSCLCPRPPAAVRPRRRCAPSARLRRISAASKPCERCSSILSADGSSRRSVVAQATLLRPAARDVPLHVWRRDG